MDVYIVAVFRAREHTMKFNAELLQKGYRASVINTPREIFSSCGISVKFEEYAVSFARQVIRYYDFQSFAGFYLKEGSNYRMIY
ncbi:MAG: DUF3343 domain-containing protein [Clostridiales bacterium]|jgi:hypothetical protein|nr:DUF3343 domain-containing protein [Clostridiales bacterium]